MAGINRLGKGPPKPGSLRPQDPNKYRTIDVFSEAGEGDADYMRMVQDIEDTQQNQVGWLFGRGAFDKGDLLYLRDEEEKRRHQELELRDSERTQFATLRAKADLEKDADASLIRLPKKEKLSTQTNSKPNSIIRVKPAKTKPPDPLDGTNPAKRQKGSDINAVEDRDHYSPQNEPKGELPLQAGAATEEDPPALTGLLPDYGSSSESEGSAS